MKEKITKLAYSKTFIGYLFVLPNMSFLTLFVFFPLIATVISSFFDFTLMLDHFSFVGWDNYFHVLKAERFWNSLKNTVYYTAVVVPVGNVISLLVALGISKPRKRNVFFRTIYFLPVVCSMTIIALSLQMMFNYNIGIIPAMLRKLGFPVIDFLNSTTWAMPTVMLISIYKNFGFNMIIYIAAIQGVPGDLYEAADIDGANSLAKFRKITVPHILPTIFFTLLTSMISSFQVFDQVYVTTKGGPLYTTETIVQLIYERAFKTLEMGFANAAAVLLFLIILIATLISWKFNQKSEKDYC